MHNILRAHIEKIIPLTDEEFELIKPCFVAQEFRKRDYIFKADDFVKNNYFIISGLTTLIYNDESGKQHIVSFAMEDWWETDMLAYISQTRATLSLQCLEDLQALSISFEQYTYLVNALPKISHFFLTKAIAGHIATQRRILSFLTSNARQRYELLLRHYPALMQRVSKNLLAAYLGVSRETLSRLFI